MKNYIIKLLLIAVLLLIASCEEKEDYYKIDLITPSDLTFTLIDYNCVKLQWTQILSNFEGYEIARRVNGGDWDNDFIRIVATEDSFIDNSLQLGSVYEYKIRSYAGSEHSAFSNTVTVDLSSLK